ncbi:unnamed protein product, partial [Prunus brigantina]
RAGLCFSQRRKAEERGEKLHGFRTHEADGFHNFRTHHHYVTYISSSTSLAPFSASEIEIEIASNHPGAPGVKTGRLEKLPFSFRTTLAIP